MFGEIYAGRMNISAMIFSLNALTTQIPAAVEQPFWMWGRGSAVQTIDIDLVRANVRVVRRDGPLEIRIGRVLGSGRAGEVTIIAAEESGVLKIRDRYPSNPIMAPRECLPPLDARGDFWNNSVRFDTVVWVPRATVVIVKVKDGRVEGADR